MRVQSHTEKKNERALYHVRVGLRENGEVVSAEEWYYNFIRENSRLSFFGLIPEEDSRDLQGTIRRVCSGELECKPGEPLLELLTSLENKLGDAYPYVHLWLEKSIYTEQGKPLFEMYITNMLESNESILRRERILRKYRFFMTLKDEEYFDYHIPTGELSLYKYINGVAFQLFKGQMDDFVKNYEDAGALATDQARTQKDTIVNFLKKGEPSFSTYAVFRKDGEDCFYRVLGGTTRGMEEMVIGVVIPEKENLDQPYYRKPEAKDPGTGILNKRAITEYSMARLAALREAPAWLFILDVDDFKLINDNYGHAFGDEVIRYVASILQEEVGERGAVGRFGGDEFFVFLERVITREDLKTLLKVIAKELLIRFDPKVRLTASIGVSHYPEDGEDFETLFAKADKSLYIAKEKGKNRHIIYEEKLHGTLEGSSIESQAVSYALSKEKTRSKMSDLILQLSMKGAGYILEDPSVQESVRAIFDVDGLLIVADGGRKVLCRNGRYIRNLDPEILPDFLAEMAGRYDENGVYVENNVAGMKESSPNLYAIMQEYEIGAFLSYAGRKDGKIDAAVFFDIFNKKRKWSDRELDLMGILGNLLIRMIEGGL